MQFFILTLHVRKTRMCPRGAWKAGWEFPDVTRPENRKQRNGEGKQRNGVGKCHTDHPEGLQRALCPASALYGAQKKASLAVSLVCLPLAESLCALRHADYQRPLPAATTSADYQRSSEETVSFLRPWRRRALSTRRPLAVAMRSRNPCLLTLLRVDGWNVLFISYLFLIFRIGRANLLFSYLNNKFFREIFVI